MQLRTDEIADGIYRISAYIPDIAPPAGFTFNQFLVAADDPLLYHAWCRSSVCGGWRSGTSRRTSAVP
jgi:hypothetical protein